MDVCVVPIEITNNVKFTKIWTDIVEYSVIEKELQSNPENFPLCLAGLLE